MKRVVWLDLAKGSAILWVVYFHFVTTCFDTPSPMSGHFLSEIAGANGWDSAGATIHTLAKAIWIAVSQVGFHAVGLFIMLSGWSLASTTWRKADKAPIGWGEWYWARFIRLYPMYWVAHLMLLIAPFTWLEPIDGRFLLSLTGLRFIDIQSNFMYGNAAWWYFAMLIQLYALFPLLFIAMRRLGLAPFLVLAFLVGFGVRYLLLAVWQSNGSWTLGGCGLSRLPEFALGMVLGIAHLKNREGVERWILGLPGVVTGLVLYWFASWVYADWGTNSMPMPFGLPAAPPYIYADLYTGLSCFLVVVGLCGWLERSPFMAKWLGLVGAFSYGLYLIHQPFVIWLGLKIRFIPAWEFLLVAAVTLVVLSAVGIFLERRVNALVDRFVAKPKAQA